MRDYPVIARERLGVFGIDEARGCLWTRAALRHAVNEGRLVRLRPGAFWIREDLPEHPRQLASRRLELKAAAAIVNNPRAVVSHASAAILHGLAVHRFPDRVCATVEPGFVGDIADVHLHRARISASDLDTVHGLQVTRPARTVVDIGREYGRTAALMSADAALHLRLTTQTAIEQCVLDCAGWPGIRAARWAAEFADGRAESPLESASRLKLNGQVPPAELQASLYSQGAFLARVDFLWEQFGVVGEADGLEKYDSAPAALRDEKLRQERLEQAGLIVIRWGFQDLGDIDRLIHRLQGAFARGARVKGAPTWSVRKMDRISV